MKARIVLLGATVLLAAYLGFMASQSLNHNQTPLKSNNPVILPSRAISVVKVDRQSVSVIESGKPVQVIRLPRSQQVVIQTDKTGEVHIEKASWMPQLVVIPHLGISCSTKIEPVLGIQVLRCEPLQTGISVLATPSQLGVGLERDILQNSYVGLSFMYDQTLTGRVAFRVGWFL